jgi:phosphoribosylglycinamide formyltransferase-1
MLRIGVLVSGGGTNLQAIIDDIKKGYLKDCKISTVVGSRTGIFALERAKENNIPFEIINRKKFENEKEYDKKMLEHFSKYEVDLIVLAGFLSLLGKDFVKAYENKIINIHPSLIPSFCGKGYYGIVPHRKVLEYGAKITGATVHFVDYEFDSGPIILQKHVNVKEGDTEEILQKRVMEEAEWIILPKAIKLFSENKLKVEGRRVKINY